MLLTTEELTVICPEQIWLSLSDDILAKSKIDAHLYSNETGCYHAHLNRICLHSLLNYWQNNEDLGGLISVPNDQELNNIWEFVNGSVITIGKTRLVLIPDDNLDTESFTIPQEWVDLPDWVGDYYLAVTVDLEAGWLNVWGYTTHRIVKEKGQYDPITYTYILDRDYLISDLDMLWVAQKMDLNDQASINPLANLDVNLAQNLINQLSQPSPFSPRLDLEFSQWGALLSNQQWREQLYQQRLQLQQNSLINWQPISEAIVNVGLWLRDEIDEIAQQLSWVLLPAFAPEAIPLRSPTQELEVIINQLQYEGLAIPSTARGAYQDLSLDNKPIRLYASTWAQLSPENEREWTLLLILAAPTGYILPEDITLSISDDTSLLLERQFDPNQDHSYLYACVTGTWEETFSVNISLSENLRLSLPPFAFRI